MKNYSTGKDASTVRFTYDGERIEKGSTPKDLDMEDNDTIEVHIEQVSYTIFCLILLFRADCLLVGRRSTMSSTFSLLPFACNV